MRKGDPNGSPFLYSLIFGSLKKPTLLPIAALAFEAGRTHTACK